MTNLTDDEKLNLIRRKTALTRDTNNNNGVRSKTANEKFCSECGGIINIKAEICPKCGVRQMNNKNSPNNKNKMIAGILALLLGGIGIHRFYLGGQNNIILGLIYLVFCWTFIPALIALVEGIFFLLWSQEEFDGKYNPELV